jgi:HEAT repeat protein
MSNAMGSLQSASLGGKVKMLKSFGKHRYRQAIPLVIRALRDNQPALNSTANQILKELGYDNLFELAALLHHEDSNVRIFAAKELGENWTEEGSTALTGGWQV